MKQQVNKPKFVKISPELHAHLVAHGRFGERFEDIIIRLIGIEKIQSHSGDGTTETYSADDVDSKKTKLERDKK